MSTIENSIVVESNFVDVLKDIVNIYQDNGGTLEEVADHCANNIYKNNPKAKTLANSIKRTVRNLTQIKC